MDENMKTYIYGLFCPDGELRYIGKCTDIRRRLNDHISNASSGKTNHHAARWIRAILRTGKKPSIAPLFEIPEGEPWESHEMRFIEEYKAKGYRLTNSTAGGEGFRGCSEESKALQRQRTAATKSLPENQARYKATLKEVFKDPDLRKRLSEINKDLWHRPGYREQRSKKFTESDHQEKLHAGLTPEVIARRAKTLKATLNTPEMKAKFSQMGVEINARPEVKAKKSASLKACWQDPDYVAKHQASMAAYRELQALEASKPENVAERARKKAERAASDAKKARERRAARKQAKLYDNGNSGYDALDIQKDQPPCA